ncbi:MAG TPA: tryptophan--tRNA ligase [Candidatus Saccharimonadales bacterium]|nr:tryptophan--tRNA ligase [Candidatus Saccharimonadales bacterium]
MTTRTTASATAAPAPKAAGGRKRILTGDRPTAKSFHLGNYYGTLANRVRLQDEYESYFLIADYHMLTTRISDLEEIGKNIRELVTDYLAVGIDPERTTIYLQSLIPEVTELFLYFAMLVTVPRAQRIPTLKDAMRDHGLSAPTYGLLGYPILQAADILMVKGDLVPVGRDQESHIELSREIARRFNDLFGPVFPVPDALIPEGGVLPGTDGNTKMGKSLGNAIFLSDDTPTVTKKIMGMFTDPTRLKATDPGKVEGNPVFALHDAFNSDTAQVADLKSRYRAGTVGDVEVKRTLVTAVEAFLAPIRDRRSELSARPKMIDEIIAAGSARAREEARQTLHEVRAAMHLDYFGL